MRHRYSGRGNHDLFNTPTPSQLAAHTVGVLDGLMYGVKTLDKRVDLLEQRVEKGFEAVDKRFDEFKQDVDRRFDAVDRRFEGVDKRLDSIDCKLSGLSDKVSGLSDKVSGLSHKFYAASIVAAVVSSVGVACLSNLDKVIAFASPAVQQPAP